MTLDSKEVRRIYAVSHLALQNSVFSVLSIRSIPYQSVSNLLIFLL